LPKHEHLPVCVYRQLSLASATFRLVGLHGAFAGSVGTARPYIQAQPHGQHSDTQDKSNTQRNAEAENNIVIMIECKDAKQAADLIADVANI